MEVIVAKTAEFCFGVNNAVEAVYSILNKGEKACTLGALIHNPEVVEDFKNKEVLIVNDPSDVREGYTLVIRSHGIAESVLEIIKEKNLKYVDATCPFVKKIHKITENQTKNGETVLIGGDKNHPEVIGIRSYCKNASFTFNNLKELKIIFKNNPKLKKEKIVIFSQTTFSLSEWLRCIEFAKKKSKNIFIFKTICSTTILRQKEADALSKMCDLMIVIGGKQSSNTAKLFDICKKNTDAIFVENANEITHNNFKNYKKIGITAGASTPKQTVEEIKEFILSKREN